MAGRGDANPSMKHIHTHTLARARNVRGSLCGVLDRCFNIVLDRVKEGSLLNHEKGQVLEHLVQLRTIKSDRRGKGARG